jgi:site-specific recombinase XerD
MPQTTPISPLRQRLIDDMTTRRLSPKTVVAYVNGVRFFAEFLHCPPDKATTDDLRLYRLELARSGLSVHAINQRIAGIRFFYTITLPSEPMLGVAKYIKRPDQLPVVLSTDEVARLLDHAPSFKYKVMLSLCYSAGLRVSELVSLKVGDIDSSRMVIRVQQGKGRKDRYTILSPQVLPMLRQWYVEAGKPKNWLFPSPVVDDQPLSVNMIRWAVKTAARDAGIAKNVSPHTLRHCFATHLLEARMDIRHIQILLGHTRIESTSHYARLAIKSIGELVSPFDRLVGGTPPA